MVKEAEKRPLERITNLFKNANYPFHKWYAFFDPKELEGVDITQSCRPPTIIHV